MQHRKGQWQAFLLKHKHRNASSTSSWVISLRARNHLGDGDSEDRKHAVRGHEAVCCFIAAQTKSLVIPASRRRDQYRVRCIFSSSSWHPEFGSITSANYMFLSWILEHKGVKH